MERLSRQLRPAALIVVGLLLAGYVACASPAYAEEHELPAGTVIQLPRNGERITLRATHWVIDRGYLDRANAAAEMNKRLTRDLLACSGTLAERTKPEPGWRVAGKWALWGISVGAAFVLGALL